MLKVVVPDCSLLRVSCEGWRSVDGSVGALQELAKAVRVFDKTLKVTGAVGSL